MKILIIFLLGLVLMGANTSTVASCYFEESTLFASGLTPGEIRLGIDDPRPNGSVYWSYDGTLQVSLYLSSGTHTAYVIERGGGKSLVRLGKQWNDYHVVAICQTIIP